MVSKGRQARGKKQQWEGMTEGIHDRDGTRRGRKGNKAKAAKQLRTSLLGDTKLSTRRHYGFLQATTAQGGAAHSGL